MAQAKVTDVSSLSGLEIFVETFKKEFPKTKSKVKIYLSELKDCFTKEESEAKFKAVCDRLYHGFPTDRQCYVENYLKTQVFQEREVARKKMVDETPGKGKALTHMASPTPVTYNFKDFEEEINKIGTNDSKKILSELKAYLEGISIMYPQRSSADVVKNLADQLQKEIQTKAGVGMSDKAQKFLNNLKTTGSEISISTDVNVKSGATVLHVQSSPFNEKAKIHQRPTARDQEQVDAMFQSSKRLESAGQTPGSQTVKRPAPDAPQQASMSKTLPPSAFSAQQITAVDKESNSATEALQLIYECLSSDSFDMPKAIKALQTQPVVLNIIREVSRLQDGIKSLKEENQRLLNQKDNKVQSLEEEKRAMEEQIKISQQNLQKLEKEKKDKEDDYKKGHEKLEAEKAGMEKKYNDYIHRDHQHIELLEANITQLQKSNEMLVDKSRKADKEIEGWKDQLQQLADDNARQKQKLSEEMHRLHRENKELKSRVSELAGAKLMDNNPDIADLSDPNRALKLGEKFSSLYDDDWTDAYQTYTEKFNMKEDEAIQFLLQVLLRTYEFCRKVADEQMDCLCNVFENPCQDIPKILTMKPQKEKTQITQKHFKDLKDLRKQIGLKKAGSITKQYVSKEYEEVKKEKDKKLKSMLDETKSYYEKCADVCWPMVLHDPPVRMEYPIKAGIKIDGNKFRLYGGNGDVLEYLVWPPLLVEGGGLLAKGVAKPKKMPRTVTKP